MAKSNVESVVEQQARVFLLTHAARKSREARVRNALGKAYGAHVVAYNDACGRTCGPVMAEAKAVAAARKWYGNVAARFLAAVRKLDNARLHATYAKGIR